MKLFRLLPHFVAGLVIAACVACTTSPTADPVLTAEKTAISSVTAARQAATAALRAGKITVEQDQATQARLNTMRASIEAAVKARDAQALNATKDSADKIAANPGSR